MAVAIGRDASSEPLNRFRSPDTPILVADSTDDIVDRLVAASIAVSRMSEAGVDREALADTHAAIAGSRSRFRRRRLDPVTPMAAGDTVPAEERPGAWRILAATERGAAHDSAGLPNQDAVAACDLGHGGVAVAVADGHGHSRHFRSARGAQLAVTAACQAVTQQLPRLDADAAAEQIGQQIREILVPAIAGLWRDAVRADIAADPLTRAEEASQWADDDAMIAYGTTLLVAVAWRTWLLLAQIGDGDILGVRPDGAALLPVPGDPLLDGRHTTSLCSPWAERSFRVAAVDLSRTALRGVLLATDGYGNAQAAEAWEHAVSSDLAGLIGAHPAGWLAEQLPLWAARCASAGGSADDTTIALLLPPGEPAPPEPGTTAR